MNLLFGDESLDVEALRRETPAATVGIHLNNAGAGLPPEPVVSAMRRYLDDELALGPHAAAERNDDALQAVGASLRTALDATQTECFDTVGRAYALLMGAVDWRPGDRILLARSEWGGVINAAGTLARNAGLSVEWLPVNDDGELDYPALSRRMDDRVRVVSMPLLPAVGGRADLRARFDRPEGCLVFGDAAQVLGQMPFTMADSGFDVIVGTARKWLRGPRGIAFAGFSPRGRRLLERTPWLHCVPHPKAVASDYTRLLRVGLGAAVDYARGVGLVRIQSRIRALAEELHAGLDAVKGVSPVYPTARNGIVAFTATGREQEVVEGLARLHIRAALPPARYHPVLFEDRGLDRVVRISVHCYNTGDEVRACVEAVDRILGG